MEQRKKDILKQLGFTVEFSSNKMLFTNILSQAMEIYATEKVNDFKRNVSESFFSSLILKAKELKELSDETEKMGDKIESFGLTAQGKGIIIAYDLLKSELNNAR